MSHRRDDQVLGTVASDLASASLALAQRFAAGGTLWCRAPGAPQHAQHVAVEFVHPVIVGTRALPAVAVLDDDAVAALRPMARAGDALLVVAGADEGVAGLLRRATAWGLTTLWLGAGPHPTAGAADHLLWIADDAGAHHDGRMVLGYHLLWELTQVCFEHPGLLEVRDEDPRCTTCSDEGRLAEVLDVDRLDATVRSAAGIESVSTMLVGPVHPGDLVLVHAGTAITVVPDD
jgi:hypothetical protein